MAPADLSSQSESPSRARRSQSISSDRPSAGGHGGLLSPPLTISPDPAFIAASAASQIVTNDHDSHADSWFDQHGIEPSGETALVAPPALKLVNRFLDQLLFNFLSVSRSTSLASLRPAVAEVLKPKLAKEAVAGADQELHEYLGGGEEEELLAFHNGLEPTGDWDLELVWKRTRLRCMVYSSLGDMEEEDEDLYTEQEHLDGPPGSTNRFSNNPGVVSPAVAIFLTSILEFMGEQVLVVAGQAAYHRLRTRIEKEEKDGSSTPVDIAERVVVDENDTERVAMDRTLGRLWRGWKKRIRSPTTSISMVRSFSQNSLGSPASTKNGAGAYEDSIAEDDQRQSLAGVLADYEHAALITLPMTDDDVREIEIPGLAREIDADEETTSESDVETLLPPRPKSLIIFAREAQAPVLKTSESVPQFSAARCSRKRSSSVPLTPPLPFKSFKRLKPLSGRSAGSDEVVAPEAENENAEVLDNSVGENSQAAAIEPKNEPANVSIETVAADSQVTAAEPQNADAVAVAEPEIKNEETSPEPDKEKGVLAAILSGAAAIGATAVAGVVAAANGEAPQTSLAQPEKHETEEDFSEEPQILTSARVSLHNGRITPEDVKDMPSRRASSRSNSVHSLRLIEVTSPKSPGRSRHGSDAAENSNGPSRASVIYNPLISEGHSPRLGSPVSRGASTSPIIRNGSSLSTRRALNSARDSISEVEEKDSYLHPGTPNVVEQVIDDDDTVTPRASTYDGPKPAVFVLAPAPMSRNSRDASSIPKAAEPVLSEANLSVFSRTPGAEHGVPPLTPLREMMEHARDTSDEYSSVAPSVDAQSITDMPVNNRSRSPSTVTVPYYQPAPPQAVDEQRLNRSPANYQPAPPAVDPQSRAPSTNTRSSPQPAVGDNLRKTSRSLHTSGSGSSSSSHKMIVVRSSEDSGPKSIETTGQSFEQLIRSDQTIQYTLTPQNMREIEVGPESPRYTTPPIPFSDTRPTTGRSHASSVGKLTTGLNSNSHADIARSSKPTTSTFNVLSRPQTNHSTGSKLRPSVPQARDARVDQDSTGDFADFIRSTGPTDPYEPLTKVPASTNGGNKVIPRNYSSSAPRAGMASPVPKRAASSAGRTKLQARDAAIPRGDSVSDLIDFVRSGPQLEKRDHRIPRTVAPFRSTMDSDQMAGAIGGKAIDATLPDLRFTQGTSNTSSVNSHSDLLNGSRNKSVPTQNRTLNLFDEEEVVPKRKTRRVRDPYAIDFSDDDEEGDFLSSRPPPIQEESLADFLKNVPPPGEPASQPVANSTPGKIKNKTSSTSLMSRFGRNTTSSHSMPPKPQSNGNDSIASGTRKTPLYTPIAAKYSTTLASSYEQPRNGNYVSQLDPTRNNKVLQKNYQPREAVYTPKSQTSDLADFLSRSEPPRSMEVKPQPLAANIQKEEASTFQRMFGRKKAAR